MARECKDCGKQVSLFGSIDGRCQECQLIYIRERSTGVTSTEHELRKAQHAAKCEDIENVLLTTETHVDLKILKRIEIVTAECAFGMNIFKDLFAGVRDVVGGRSAAVQKTLRDSRRVALYELKKEAHAIGANAVIGVDLDYTEISSGGNMILLVASGTAVIVEQT